VARCKMAALWDESAGVSDLQTSFLGTVRRPKLLNSVGFSDETDDG